MKFIIILLIILVDKSIYDIKPKFILIIFLIQSIKIMNIAIRKKMIE